MKRKGEKLVILVAALGLLPAERGEALLLKIQPGESRVWFDATAGLLGGFRGTSDQVRGWVKVADLTEPKGAEAYAEIEVKSLRTGIGRRDRDMMRYLEAEKYPKITFLLKEVHESARQGEAFRVVLQGDLTLHGVTRPLSIPVEASPSEGTLRVEGKVDLRMSDFGIKKPRFPFLPLITVKDEVTVSFRIVALEEAEGSGGAGFETNPPHFLLDTGSWGQ